MNTRVEGLQNNADNVRQSSAPTEYGVHRHLDKHSVDNPHDTEYNKADFERFETNIIRLDKNQRNATGTVDSDSSYTTGYFKNNTLGWAYQATGNLDPRDEDIQMNRAIRIMTNCFGNNTCIIETTISPTTRRPSSLKFLGTTGRARIGT